MGRRLLKGLEGRRKGNGKIFLSYYDFKNKHIKMKTGGKVSVTQCSSYQNGKGIYRTGENTQRLYVRPMAHT